MDTKIFLLNFLPTSCPGCQMWIRIEGPAAITDFFGSASHTCPGCGAKFCFVKTKELLSAADNMDSDLSERV